MVTRIRQLLDTKQLTPTQFADFIGVGRPVMSHILSERNKPSLEVVQRIISAFPEVSVHWLLSGLGEMLGEAIAAGPATGPVAEETYPAPHPLVNTAASIEEPATVSDPIEPAAEEPQPASVAEIPATIPPAAPALPMAQAAPTASQVVPAASQPVAVTPQLLPADAIGAAPNSASVTSATPAAMPPLRAARFVPPTTAAARASVVAPRRPAGAAPTLPASETAAATAKFVVAPPLLAADMPAVSSNTAPTVSKQAPEAAVLPFLGEPGKEIKRIVIFYRDGSFADYQPEA